MTVAVPTYEVFLVVTSRLPTPAKGEVDVFGSTRRVGESGTSELGFPAMTVA